MDRLRASWVTPRSGSIAGLGDPAENRKQAVEGLGRLCEYAEKTPVQVVIEPHGRNSQDLD